MFGKIHWALSVFQRQFWNLKGAALWGKCPAPGSSLGQGMVYVLPPRHWHVGHHRDMYPVSCVLMDKSMAWSCPSCLLAVIALGKLMDPKNGKVIEMILNSTHIVNWKISLGQHMHQTYLSTSASWSAGCPSSWSLSRWSLLGICCCAVLWCCVVARHWERVPSFFRSAREKCLLYFKATTPSSSHEWRSRVTQGSCSMLIHVNA